MISVIVPTLGTRISELKRLLESIQSQDVRFIEVIIVSQDHHEKVAELIGQFTLKIKHICINQRGLSLARNKGMEHVTGDIVTFSDDDCWYHPEAFINVQKWFEAHRDSSVVTFQIYDPISKSLYKEYPSELKLQISKKELFRKSSIEMFIHLDMVDRDDIIFNEQFGLGAAYPSGEENLFLFHLYRKGYYISYCPKTVVYHLKPELAAKLSYSMFVSKGPLLKAIYNTPIGIALLSGLFIKKFRHLQQPFRLYQAALKQLMSYQKD
ncbi:putative glycosyltransferase [Bacillus sp. TS-2]|nr:putative glycosyltransferase [Bacillus sp. TS-2]